ncbi:MAG: aspartate 1-decarboxylase [Desulfovibrionaceae bacterium]
MRCFLQAKIHRAVITGSKLDYEGSLAVGPELLEASGIRPFERIEVYNLDNGERFATYAIRGEAGEVCLNGAAARKGRAGQRVIIAAYAWLEDDRIEGHEPCCVLVGPDNSIASVERHSV